ncbi:class C beta-lactamase [Paramesorhizobium deserti]|uniref:Beta-lactamase n=1 Tax=Paramesorhizobium deserti TaxID=1494590 RepID=A0A135HQZ9_9HYPH|nr:class C beta-lactamase [Paramesorhizobium deserti]KXF75616.1 class C beta-lactamase [Paramesorhizobium deserti]
MTKSFLLKSGVLAAATLFIGADVNAAGSDVRDRLQQVVSEAVLPVMKEYAVPGLAVAVTAGGRQYFFNYGVASKENDREVTENTLFEIGSISKTFNATLAGYAEAVGKLSFTDKASKYWPALNGSSFDRISLLELGAYTAGGLPLQFPKDVTTDEKMLAYYRNWRPDYAPGTHRQYSNPSIGLFGYLTARSMNAPYDELMSKKLLAMLDLRNTYVKVPENRMGDYAYGYLKDGKPVRVSPGVLDSEAYGVRTTSADLIKFVEKNIDPSKLNPALRKAIAATHTGYYWIRPMTQSLGWELYPYPVALDRLLEGNSAGMARKANKAEKLDPPLPPQEDILLNKTGSTRGFGAYAAFVPTKRIGVVILANKAYPIPERVKAGYRILQALDRETGSASAR